ncbi:MAG: 2-oxo acid dehydrogenase subunit E2 [Ardenticatenaceae bacterium]|nr:2-oxo acid dehydrogenase subunit E2 [Ardenticatenaceae bacterium]HBY95375.1 hypothetical protein [Chloroflexota bacterium]
MATEVRLPQWGMGMQEGTVGRWLKREGDAVQEGEDLVEVEAAKVNEVMPAPASGVLGRILVPEGTTVPVRELLALIVAPGEALPEGRAAPREAPTPAPAPPRQAETRIQVTPVARRLAREHGIDLSQIQGSGSGGRITDQDVRRAIEGQAAPPPPPAQVEPRARRLATEHGIDLSQVRGSGPVGRITEADVRRAIEEAEAPTPETVSLTGVRGVIARRLHESLQTMAQVTLTAEADVTDLVKQREELKQQFDLTYTDLVIKAVAFTLKAHPRLNARVEGEDIRLVPESHIGVAVSLEDGLIVPVVRNAGQKTLGEIAQETRRLAQQAREGTLTPAEVTGSTFTVTNLGVYGVDAFTPIINPPEVAILGVGRIFEKPTRRNGGLLWRQTMTLSLTFDHRVVDGAPAAAFLQALIKCLETPARLAE